MKSQCRSFCAILPFETGIVFRFCSVQINHSFASFFDDNDDDDDDDDDDDANESVKK